MSDDEPKVVRARCFAREHEGEWHEFTAAEAKRLLELMSFEDLEDGPRCLVHVLKIVGLG